MDFSAKPAEKNKTEVICTNGVFPDSKHVFNIPFEVFIKRIKRREQEFIPFKILFPELSSDENEFLISGCPVGMWDYYTKEEE